MKTETATPRVGFTRCAVCKINLKGRFVYVDEETEKLLGCSSEELFGKSLFDFLDKPSLQLIDTLLMQRNHYETFYDSSHITLITAKATRVGVEVIASLNFNAGNPVNFQLILITKSLTGERIEVVDDAAINLLHAVAQPDSNFGWKQCLNILRSYSQAKQISVYQSSEGVLKARIGVSEFKNGDFEFQDIPEPGPLQNYCANSDFDYDFTNEACVARAIEESGSAPNEFITRLDLIDSESYLVVISFAENLSDTEAKTAVNKARLGLGVIGNLLKLGLASSESNQENYDVKFTIGFLDALGIGAALVQSDGQVSGYNSSLMQQLGSETFEGTCLDLVASISADNKSLSSLVEKFYNATLNDDDYQDLSVVINLPFDLNGRMVITRFSYDPNDRSSALVVIPETIVPTQMNGAGDNMGNVWSKLVSRVELDLRDILELTEDFGHTHFDEGNTDAANDLEELINQVINTTDRYKNLSMLLPLLKRAPIEKVTDLNLLLKRISSNIKSEFPGLKINQALSKVDKISTDSEKAEAILMYLSDYAASKLKLAGSFLNLASLADNDAIKIVIETEVKKNLVSTVEPDFELSIALTLAADLGWQVNCESDNKAGFRATLTIPRP